MIKLVLFDLDGVLVDAKTIHYEALNFALGQYAISEEEHRNLYDGRKTKDKLQLLSERKGLPVELHQQIFEEKQKHTIRLMNGVEPIEEIKLLFAELEQRNYMIGVCSNSIRRTVLTALAKTELIEHCSVILSNEDVTNSKPHPEIYWKAMSMMRCLPEETLIIEDSPPGLLAAERSRATYIRVDNPYDVTRDKIVSSLLNSKHSISSKWKNEKLNVIIPMAGAGSRFVQAGYTFPKPLIQINNKTMIQLVVENLGLDANYIFIVQKEHKIKYNIDSMLRLIVPNCTVIETSGITEGAACTALLAKEHFDNNYPLFFANSDQYVTWNPIEFMYMMQETDADGGIVTFKAMHPKWSFAKIDDAGFVTEVAEKNPISDNATVGFYYWKHGCDFVRYASQMIEKKMTVNNEFYICPVFNEAIQDNKKIRAYQATEMWGLGTPEDLEFFIKNFKM